MNHTEFEKLVEEGIGMIPERFLALLKNVAIVVEDEPTKEQLRKMKMGDSHLLLGLYEGVPQTKRSSAYGMVLPDKITIFKKSIEKISKNEQQIKEQVKDVVWHEIAHHFGSDERGAREAERKRRNSK